MQDKIKAVATSDKEVMGFRLNDLLGICMMVIPFLISVKFSHQGPGNYFLFIQTSPGVKSSIRPNLISSICALVFYASLVVRYTGIFRAGNLFEGFVSSVRAFLNCWVISALVSLAIPTNISSNGTPMTGFFSSPQSTLLIIALLLSWLGMKTIAGYSWILFIVAAWSHLLELNSAMGMLGAVFIITLGISLFLQIKDYANIREFMQDFRAKGRGYASKMQDDINSAAFDASEKAQRFGNAVSEHIDAYTGIKHPSSDKLQQNGVKINLEALDLNKDGMVDDKDFELLYNNKSKVE